jgi:putative cell wall-binding protein
LSKGSVGRARRTLAAALAAVTATAGMVVLVSASPSSAAPDVVAIDVFGADRYQTAIESSKQAFPTNGATANAIVTTGENFPDALAASALAGHVGGPVLLTPRASLPGGVEAELTRLGVTTVYLVGGPVAVSNDVATALAKGGARTVQRVSGETRIETAVAVASQIGGANIGNFNGKRTAFVSTGANFPDAVASSVIAYAGKHPILLTDPANLSVPVSSALTNLGIQHVIIMGGTQAVSDTVKTQIEAKGITTQRIGGANRFATAADLLELAQTASPNGFDFSVEAFILATGNVFPDALSAAALGGKNRMGIVLTGTLPPESANAIADDAATWKRIFIHSGPHRIDAATREAALVAAGKGGTGATFPPSIIAPMVRELNADVSNGAVRVNFTGLPSTVDVFLAPCGNDSITTGASGGTQFMKQWDGGYSDDYDDEGETYTGNAFIQSLNGSGAGLPDDDEADVPTDNGALEVQVNTTGADCLRVVVARDTDDDADLDVDTLTRVPTDAFGVSGPIIYTLGEAQTGSSVGGAVMFHDAANRILYMSDGRHVKYDAEDTYIYSFGGGQLITQSVFAGLIDSVYGAPDVLVSFIYSRTNQNSFTLVDGSVQPPALTVGAAGHFGGSDDVQDRKFVVTPPPNAQIEHYNLTVVRDDNPDEPCDGSQVGTDESPNEDPNLVFDDLVDGDYCAFVTAVTRSGSESRQSRPVPFTQATGEQTAPLITDIHVESPENDASPSGVLSPGDIIWVDFNEDMDTGDTGPGNYFRFTRDGRVYQVECGVGGNVCTWPDDDNLDIEIGADPEAIVLVSGTAQPLSISGDGADVTEVTGFTDEAGNAVNLAGSTDKKLNAEDSGVFV